VPVDWTLWLIEQLKYLKDLCGNWGVAIILLTILVRLALIPFSISQQRSMKKMQELSPKLKQLQETYKSDPPKLQKKMMEFYKENKFNPLGGCLPLLLQMPVFIILYTSLVSVTFLQMAGPSSFLFIHRLDGTLQTYAGKAYDGVFNVQPKDKFITAKYDIQVKLKDGNEVKAEIDDYRNAVKHFPKEIQPGKPLTMTLALDKVKFKAQNINTADVVKIVVPVVNDNSKEIEYLSFSPTQKGNELVTEVKTASSKKKFNYDVLILIVIFGITMFFSQKVMTAQTPKGGMDPQQQAMQESMGKMMPLMIMAMFIMVPIPAGVLLYMVVSNVFQVGQTLAINKYLDYEKEKEKVKNAFKDNKIVKSSSGKDDDSLDKVIEATYSVSNPESNSQYRLKRKNRKANKKFK
jgi:YidC/Oxa1 family membrane protein insertase